MLIIFAMLLLLLYLAKRISQWLAEAEATQSCQISLYSIVSFLKGTYFRLKTKIVILDHT